MVYQHINFYLGYICTREELLKDGLIQEVDEDFYEPTSGFESLVHGWHCCSELSQKMFVVGVRVCDTSRKWGYSCGKCTLQNHIEGAYDSENSDEKLCDQCLKNWKNHSGPFNNNPMWCENCYSKWDDFYKDLYGKDRRMKALSLCDTCIGVCIEGTFDVVKMQNEIVKFDGFPPYMVNKKEETVDSEKKNCICMRCDRPCVNVAATDPCPHCNYPNAFRDEYPRSYDNSYIGRKNHLIPQSIKDRFQNKQLTIVAIPDDCLSCS